jgi:hypothetical protein
MAVNELYYDKRLQEKSLRDGKLSPKDVAASLKALKDSSANLMEFDEEGNPTNEVERELKTLEMKLADPEIYVAYEPELDEFDVEDGADA